MPQDRDRWTPDVRRLATTVNQPLVAVVLLLLVYGLLSLLNDPSGYLGADTGAKVYTLEVMTDRGTTSPDIGYWAEEHDPNGSLHPVHHTRRQSDGSWVAVTTLPMLELAAPLYDWGGYRATLILPMLGGVLAALAARFLARRLHPGTDGSIAFWMVGLASPLAIYALDFWEHTLGAAAMVGAAALLFAVLDRRPLWLAIPAGALLGVGATLRNETLVYGLVIVGGICLAMAVRGRVVDAVVAGAATVVGFVGPWFANAWLESSVQGLSRASRATSTASSATGGGGGGSLRLGERAEEGLQTFVGLFSGDPAVSILAGGVLVAAIVIAARAERRGDRQFAMFALGAVALVFVADAIGGLGFIPGLLVAFPLATGALLPVERSRDARLARLLALLALPVAYAFMFLGGAGPQWGGRYTLTSAVILGVVALGGLVARYPVVGRGLIGLSFAVTSLGVAWVWERTHSAARFFDDVAEFSEPVLIARQAFILREGGADLVDRRWLSVENESEFMAAVDVARAVGEERFSVLEWDGAAPPEAALPDDVTEVRRSQTSFVDTPVGLVTYEFED